MNPAIVAPDAFDIVSMGVDKGLTADQVDLHLIISFILFIIPGLSPCRRNFL